MCERFLGVKECNSSYEYLGFLFINDIDYRDGFCMEIMLWLIIDVGMFELSIYFL